MRNIDLKHPAFYSLSLSDREYLLRNSAILPFAKNEIIIKQGSFITHIYYLLSGMAKEDYTIRNQNNTIRVVPEQRFIGLLYSFPGRHFEIRATAVTNCEVLLIDVESFKTVIRTNGNFALSVIDTMAITSTRVISRQLLYHTRNIDGTLAAFLLQLHDLNNKTSFELPLSRKEIAETIGYTRESVVHSFSRFIKDGLIEQNGKVITLKNIPFLREIVNKS